jgi:hypothetical protein
MPIQIPLRPAAPLAATLVEPVEHLTFRREMRFLLRKLGRLHIWRRLFVERLTEPVHLNIMSVFVALFGSLRARIAFDLVIRQHHAFGLLRAADSARALGRDAVTAVEFGVASGAGLLNLCEVARRIAHATGVRFEIIGFDTGAGMPQPVDYRDHPEYYAAGDFPMDRPALTAKLPPNARVIYGDVSETVAAFLRELTAEAPLGFVSLDLDYYSSSRAALRLLADPDASKYLPMVPVYLDDVAFRGHNEWCGELLAVKEFNAEWELRKISKYNFLRNTRVFKNPAWIDHMYALHVLDHAARQAGPGTTSRPPFVIDNPYL